MVIGNWVFAAEVLGELWGHDFYEAGVAGGGVGFAGGGGEAAVAFAEA